MRVAVSGANGFVGQFVVSGLMERGLSVIPLVRSRRGSPDEIIIGNLSSGDPLRLPPLDVVIHLAAMTAQIDSLDKEALEQFRRVNVAGTKRLLVAAAEAGVRRFVFMSSIKVNGDETFNDRPFRDADVPRPGDAYGVSKWEAEQLVKSFCMANGLDWTIVRAPLVYGPGVKGNFNLLTRLALSGIPLPFAKTSNRRSLVYVQNLSDFLIETAIHDDAGNRTFLISDQAISTAALLEAISAASGKKIRLFSFPSSMLEMAAKIVGKEGVYRRLFGNLEVDSASAKSLGWEPRVTLEESLCQTLRGGDKSQYD